MRNGFFAGGESDTESPPPHVSQRVVGSASPPNRPAWTGPDQTSTTRPTSSTAAVPVQPHGRQGDRQTPLRRLVYWKKEAEQKAT